MTIRNKNNLNIIKIAFSGGLMNILLIGSGAREHVIAETIKKNKEAKLYSFMKTNNPGIASLSKAVALGSYSDLEKIKQFAKKIISILLLLVQKIL